MRARLRDLTDNPHRVLLAGAVWGTIASRAAGSPDPTPLREHVDDTYRWLCQAQDATADGGVAGLFDLWSGTWSGAYPETTGYIIPSFLAFAQARSDEQAAVRALRMADWSCAMQMEDGAILSGLVGIRRGPAVFNTGQAIFGFVSAYAQTREERYALAARRASEWLLSNQSPDGAWRRNLSVMTTAPVLTYNGRCAWALAYAAAELDEPRFTEAAIRASDWVLAQQNSAGWFANNTFAAGEAPLLHTIAYVIEGLLGVFAFTGERRFLQAALRAVSPVVELVRTGHLAGRLDETWRPTVRWRCPPGEAQIATVLHRLERLCPGNEYGMVARRLIDGLVSVQHSLGRRYSTAEPSPATGGLPGSFPVWGAYMRFQLPNWAAKFLLDALLLETAGIDEPSFPPAADRAGSGPAP